MRKALIRLIIIGTAPFIIMGTGMMLSQATGIGLLFSLSWLLRIISIILGIFLLLQYFYCAVIKNTQLKESYKNILLGIYTFTISILGIELGLTFYSQSTLNPASYSSINWFLFNWKPINSEGNRDDEVKDNHPIDVLFMGDSFTAGVGIEDYKKRFSNLVETQGRYNTLNMGRNGQNLPGVIDQLEQLRLKPKFIFVQYYVNDIIETGEKLGYEYNPISYSYLESFAMFSSYLFNYYYTRKYSIADDEIGFIEHLDSLLSIPKVRETHLRELDKIITFADYHNTELVFILFPFLPDPCLSTSQIDLVNNHLQSNGIKTIQVAKLISKANLKPKQCVVNRYDEHPSIIIHQLLAKEITAYLAKAGKN